MAIIESPIATSSEVIVLVVLLTLAKVVSSAKESCSISPF